MTDAWTDVNCDSSSVEKHLDASDINIQHLNFTLVVFIFIVIYCICVYQTGSDCRLKINK